MAQENQTTTENTTVVNTVDTTVDNNETTAETNQKTPVFFIEKAMEWRNYIDRILTDKALVAKLNALNYSEKTLKDASTAIRQLIEAIEFYHVSMERRKGITQAKNEAEEALHKTYMYHKTLIKNLFSQRQELIGTLRADNPVPRRKALWIRNVKAFYTQLQTDAVAVKALGAYSVTPTVLKNCLKDLESIEKMLVERDNISVELQNLTEQNAEKKLALTSWMSQFKQIARRGLANDKESLIKLEL
ncbi:MAG: hypothetical protein AAGI07_14095 [Bacteroidota bacterium]